MLFHFLEFWVNLGMRIWFRAIYRHFEAPVPENVPIIFACNHPNSAIDFVPVGMTANRPVHVLVRGDIFQKPVINFLLRGLWLLPVYRIRDGFSSLSRNDDSFRECYDLFDRKGLIHIFSEGISIQEKNLQPLKKGTARLALDYHMSRGHDIAVVPVTMNYTRFRQWRNSIMMRYGKPIYASDYRALSEKNPQQAYAALTADLQASMQEGIIEYKDYKDESLVEKALMTQRFGRPLRPKPWMGENASIYQEESAWATRLNEMNEEELPQSLKDHGEHIDGNTDGILSKPTGFLMLALRILLVTPIFLISMIPLVIPYLAAEYLVKHKIKDIIFHTTVRIMGTLVIYMVQLIIITVVALIALGLKGLWVPIAVAASSFVVSEIADEFVVTWKNRYWWSKLSTLRKIQKDVAEALSPLPDSTRASESSNAEAASTSASR